MSIQTDDNVTDRIFDRHIPPCRLTLFRVIQHPNRKILTLMQSRKFLKQRPCPIGRRAVHKDQFGILFRIVLPQNLRQQP